jgi:hypothetical protein
MRHILDQSFIYTRSIDTDIRKTFVKVRERLKEEAKEKAKVVTEIKRAKGKANV